MDKDDHRERIIEGMRYAAAMGRKPGPRLKVTDAQIKRVLHLPTIEAAKRVGLSKARFITRRKMIEQRQAEKIPTPPATTTPTPEGTPCHLTAAPQA